jgi:hypothetical protein
VSPRTTRRWLTTEVAVHSIRDRRPEPVRRGPPRRGKIIVVRRPRERLESGRHRCGEVRCPDPRSDSDRVISRPRSR